MIGGRHRPLKLISFQNKMHFLGFLFFTSGYPQFIKLYTVCFSFSFGPEGSSGGSFEDLPNSLLALGGALEVGEGVDLLGHRPPLLRLHWLLLHLPELLDCVGVVAEVLLVADRDDGDVGAEVFHLWRPLLGDVLQRVWRVNGEAHEDDICVWVGERAQSVIVFLPSCVPQR